MSEMRDYALQYARRGWPVFRLSGNKVPIKDTHAHLDATTDTDVIEAWWSGRGRNLNIGLACGDIIVLDADGPGGLAYLVDLAKPHGGLPRTLAAITTRGFHFYYRKPEGAGDLRKLDQPREKKGDDGLDIKAGGGYVVLPPSLNRKSGRRYQWVEPQEPIAELPAWLVDYIVSRGGRRERQQVAPPIWLGERPGYLTQAPDLTTKALDQVRRDLPPLADVIAALRRIPASIGNFEWFRIKCMIRDYDAGDLGLAIFKAWSKTSARHDWAEAEHTCEKEWARPEKPLPENEKLHVGSLLKEAANYPPPAEPAPEILAKPSFEPTYASTGFANGKHADHATFGSGDGIVRKVVWADIDEDGHPRLTCANTAIAITGLGVTCRKDTFHDRLIIGGHFIQQWAGDLTDDAVHMLRRQIKRWFHFDPGERHARDAAVALCLENAFNPVLDYLGALRWDGRERVARWVVDYLGAPADRLTCEFGRLMLVAAVRRARVPGTKFDQIVVMEGPEGRGKSTALRILAGEANFSDQHILGASDREQLEAVAGVWIHEIAELAGMRRAEVEAVKVFASKTEDRARPAYGRFRVDRPRQTIFVGTTNSQTYLKSDTGDRRFWPMPTGRIDTDAIARDRDQLWAEAARIEARGESLTLDWRLWSDAARVQASRQEIDPWLEDVRDHFDRKPCDETSIKHVLQEVLRIEPGRCDQAAMNRAARVLRCLNFVRFQKRLQNSHTWLYRRESTGDSVTVGTK